MEQTGVMWRTQCAPELPATAPAHARTGRRALPNGAWIAARQRRSGGSSKPKRRNCRSHPGSSARAHRLPATARNHRCRQRVGSSRWVGAHSGALQLHVGPDPDRTHQSNAFAPYSEIPTQISSVQLVVGPEGAPTGTPTVVRRPSDFRLGSPRRHHPPCQEATARPNFRGNFPGATPRMLD